MAETVHNPDQFMFDLRQILAQGRKRIGLLLGAGCPASIQIDPKSGDLQPDGQPLVPAVAELTQGVITQLTDGQRDIVSELQDELGHGANIEAILSRARALGDVLGQASVGERSGPDFRDLAAAICNQIGSYVAVDLPAAPTPFTELVSWIGGTSRNNAIEIFTPNYDLLLEESFERARLPYFDGFTGAFRPFFDPSTIANNDLPARWVRLWKLHGSLGWWRSPSGTVVRSGNKSTTELIYPEHLKYEQTQKLPYTALFSRLRNFLLTPDTLLVSCGFSFLDAHISAVIEETLAANPSASVFAMQYGDLTDEAAASTIGKRCPNLSVYTSDGAVINCIPAPWRIGELPSKEWAPIRATYWEPRGDGDGMMFTLGSFQAFAHFFGRAKTSQMAEPTPPETAQDEDS